MRPFFSLGAHLLSDSRLVVLLHPVKAVTVQVEHQDSEATHNLCLSIGRRRGGAAPSHVHFCTDLINLLVAEFNLSSIVPFARTEADCLITQIFFLLLVHCNDALTPVLHAQIPRAVYLLESALFECTLGHLGCFGSVRVIEG